MPRKTLLTDEIQSWLEKEFFSSKENSDRELREKLKKKFKINVRSGTVNKWIGKFFADGHRIKKNKGGKQNENS